MTRIAWLTDIHLNFIGSQEVGALLDDVCHASPDVVLISGDVAEARDVVSYLERIDDVLQRPVFFVLGNHDYYFGSIADVRCRVAELCARRPYLKYLTQQQSFGLTADVGLVGHDGWADARIGDYERSMVTMNDHKLIEELSGVGKEERWHLLKALGDAAAEHIRRVLPTALDTYSHVYLVTHVPPFREACWYDGRISDDEWAPHFTCRAVGDAILQIMRQRTDRRLTVLCGHTHGWGESVPCGNVLVLTGGALYGKPAITGLFDLP